MILSRLQAISRIICHSNFTSLRLNSIDRLPQFHRVLVVLNVDRSFMYLIRLAFLVAALGKCEATTESTESQANVHCKCQISSNRDGGSDPFAYLHAREFIAEGLTYLDFVVQRLNESLDYTINMTSTELL